MRHLVNLLLSSGLLLLLGSAASPAASVTLQMESGRRFTGELDQRTSREQLWLRWSRAGVELRRPVSWQHLQQVEVDGEVYSPAELWQVVTSSRWPAHDPFVDDAEPVPLPAAQRRQPLERTALWPVPPPVRAIHVQAASANWDAGVPVDGVVAYVLPLDEWGNVVPVTGSVELQVTGQLRSVPTGSYGAVLLGTTTIGITPEQLGPAGYACKIPFQYASPEFNAGLGSFGIVHARLSVPGDGVFDASAAMVRVRPYSAIRDRFEQTRGTRFLPDEALGNVPGEIWRP